MKKQVTINTLLTLNKSINSNIIPEIINSLVIKQYKGLSFTAKCFSMDLISLELNKSK